MGILKLFSRLGSNAKPSDPDSFEYYHDSKRVLHRRHRTTNMVEHSLRGHWHAGASEHYGATPSENPMPRESHV